ncbi:MAG TPA: nitroreductase [Chthonomonadaceae bacterium]|nr:nitroreductase [Chthonomonadaceae bacterium]
MEAIEAIYKRRSVRSYTGRPVDKETIQRLLHAAVQAPSARNAQPWAFAVLQGAERLKAYSDRVKTLVLQNATEHAPARALHPGPMDPDYNIFHGAGTLIVIYTKSGGEFAPGDCCQAGQNLMLAACALGLGTCPIGFSLPWLRLPETRRELDIPEGYLPILPIVVGYPKAPLPPPPDRSAPEIVRWL